MDKSRKKNLPKFRYNQDKLMLSNMDGLGRDGGIDKWFKEAK